MPASGSGWTSDHLEPIFFAPPMKRARRLSLITVALVGAFWSVPLHSQSVQTIDGLWASDGYGLLTEIRGNRLSGFEITSISCMPSSTGTRKSSAGSDQEAVFTVDGGLAHFLPGPSADDARIHFDGAVSDIVMHRISAKPKACERKPADTPQENYAIFWQTFAENYAFFDLRHVDWAALDKQFRPQVTSATGPKELFRIFQTMIQPLQDAHTGIFARGIRSFNGRRPDPSHLVPEEWVKARKIIEAQYVRAGLQAFCQGHVQFGMLKGSIAYLRVESFYSYARGGYAHELSALQAALDVVFRDAQQFRGLVIDVRRNSGGADPLGVEIASRLAGEKYLAYRKVTRNNLDGPLHFTPPQEAWVPASTRPGFRGKVVLLTGPDTISAGETFAMALMGRVPGVTRIGLNTQGVFSDVLERSLPNGWRFGLPNEVYLTKDGKAFDGPGVPPDVRVPFFSRGDLESGRDAALDKAMEILGAAESH